MGLSTGRRLRPIEIGAAIEFTFDGEPVLASPTDSVASALIASGHRVFGTSPHDDHPYGGFCFVGRCSECLVVIDGQPGAFACTTKPVAGMLVETQHRHGHWDGANEA